MSRVASGKNGKRMLRQSLRQPNFPNSASNLGFEDLDETDLQGWIKCNALAFLESACLCPQALTLTSFKLQRQVKKRQGWGTGAALPLCQQILRATTASLVISVAAKLANILPWLCKWEMLFSWMSNWTAWASHVPSSSSICACCWDEASCSSSIMAACACEVAIARSFWC